MKKSVFALILAVVVAACMQPPSTNDGRNLSNEAIVVKYADALVNGRVDEMGTYLADNYKVYGPAMTDSATREQELQGWRNNWDSVYTSISYDRYAMLSTHVDSGRVAGDWVFDWGIVTLNFKSGKTPVNFWWHGVHRIKDGKIDLARGFYDVNDILVQRGFTVTPPQPM
jgi:hypothetical protein